MRKRFQITGLCVPEKHYMVDLSGRLKEIRGLIEDGAYFTINRARQYGKTTLLYALSNFLADEYLVIRLDFQAFGSASYRNENTFSLAFASFFAKAAVLKDTESVKNQILQKLMRMEATGNTDFDLRRLFQLLLEYCQTASRPVVLMIDETDHAGNHPVFLDFLAQLRYYYLEREATGIGTFQSVILAGVYDIRNLKRKMRGEEAHRYNSPWNIAARFKVTMSFSIQDISGMLGTYEADCHTGMDIHQMAVFIYQATSGYPVLVSQFCKLIDEEISVQEPFGNKKEAWTRAGFLQAERMILSEKNTLFDSLTGRLYEYPQLNKMFKKILFTGADIVYNADEPSTDMAAMFGFIKNQNGYAVITNRIFETRLYNFYLSSAKMQDMDIYKSSQMEKNQFIVDGHLQMRKILEKFVEHFHDLYKDYDASFAEDMGRRLFLLYLKPIINGTGNYYIEAQTRDLSRTDVIVDYHGEQFIIEMKIWHGREYHERGEQQLLGYLDAYHKRRGYLLSFNFNKKKKTGVHEIRIGDKLLIEAVV